MFDLLIKNGTVITASETFRADVAVKEGKVAALLESGCKAEAGKIVDATGKYVLPGAIDVHTHLALPFGGTFTADDYESGTRAAACGGTTMVFDYATPPKGMRLADFVQERRDMADAQVCIDYGFHMVLNDPNDKALEQLQELVDGGISSFKVYTVYDGMAVDDAFFVKLLERCKDVGALVCVHAENKDMINMYIDRYKNEGKLSPWWHYMSRREFIEAEADKRCIHWAKAVNAPLYIVHLANKEGVEELGKARQEGYDITAETNALYLKYNCDVYKREDGRNFVCSPSIKGEDSRLALWDSIRRGIIDTIATDHCPFMQKEKDWGIDDFTKIPNGCDGVEVRYPYLLSEANSGSITFNKAVEVCCTNPAKIFGCAPRKGSITVGADADIVVYDPEKEVTLTNNTLHTKSDFTVWEGVKLKGYPVMTFSRGSLVYDNGEFVGKAGYGKYIKRAPYKKA
ncbi:MAG: dihydropyrimidinase [Acetivibrionales bacterium]|jgi:dihydropyrimidinase